MLNTKDKIIDSAIKAFLQKGLFETVMDDIAQLSGLARRTLYRYFSTKEELAYEVVIFILEEWNHDQTKTVAHLNGKGIEKLDAFLNSLIAYMVDKNNVMRFMGEFDFYFKDGISYQPNTDVMNRFNDVIHVSDELIELLISEGIDDGSIQLEEDIKTTVATISNVLWGFGQRISIRKEVILKEFNIPAKELIDCQIRMYIKAMKKSR